MDAANLIRALDRFQRILPAVVADVSDPDARWKPPDGAWSILEIARHLLDEETDDFHPRLELTLRDPALDWPPLDPEKSAVERRYNEANLADTVKRFVAERQTSIKWLNSLANPIWIQARRHPRFGPIHAGDLLASWAGHDALHLRQIAKRMWQLAQRDAPEFSTAYAGEWKA